jgi:site-specific DNA-methyltransferase (adenine-specific)
MAGGVVSFIESEGVRVYHGDCIEVMRTFADDSVDSVVTDPPYLIDFMGKGWDSADGIAGKPEVWREALRVLKPGGHLLAFGGTRTWHRLAVAIEDAGFEVRDNIAYLHDGGLPGPMCWAYGSGFPKSLDVSKAIDKRAGAERDRQAPQSRKKPSVAIVAGGFGADGWAPQVKEAITPEAQKWAGFGTALKPAHEPIVVARKPLIGTVAENVLTHGTGALNIDGCRIGTEETLGRAKGGWGNAAVGADNYGNFNSIGVTKEGGRWPANVIFDESQAAELDKQSGQAGGGYGVRGKGGSTYANGQGFANTLTETGQVVGYGDTGGASRFFYVAKAGKKERPNVDGVAHPTVKPIALMRYLVRLVTPPGGTVLEPFAGSGTTVEACILEGFNCIAIEMTDDYLPLIAERVRRSTEDKEGRLL